MPKVKTETPKARKLKQIYLELGPERTIDKTADTYRKSYGRCSTKYAELLSTSFNWVEEARGYDIELENNIRSKHITEIAKMQERHAKEARVLQGLAIKRLKDAKPEQLRLQDCARFLRDGVSIEREALGLKDKADVVVEGDLNVDSRVQSVQNVNKTIISALGGFPDAKAAVLKLLEDSSNNSK